VPDGALLVEVVEAAYEPSPRRRLAGQIREILRELDEEQQ
jgi:hypothetical protein